MGCYLSSVEPILKCQSKQHFFLSHTYSFSSDESEPRIGSIDSKITQIPSTNNFASTTTSLNACSPQNQIVQTATKIKALKDSKGSFYDFEGSVESKLFQSQSFFQQTSKLSLKEQMSMKFGQAFKLKSQITSSSESFEKDYLFVEKIGRGNTFSFILDSIFARRGRRNTQSLP